MLPRKKSSSSKCGYCDFAADNKVLLSEHLKFQHNGWSPAHCMLLTFYFLHYIVEAAGLYLMFINGNLVEFSAIKTYHCEECDFKSINKTNYKRHKYGHLLQERPYKCFKCKNYTSDLKWETTLHLLACTGDPDTVSTC